MDQPNYIAWECYRVTLLYVHQVCCAEFFENTTTVLIFRSSVTRDTLMMVIIMTLVNYSKKSVFTIFAVTSRVFPPISFANSCNSLLVPPANLSASPLLLRWSDFTVPHIPPAAPYLRARPAMASAVEVAFARSQALQEEWNDLLAEMGHLDASLARRPAPAAAARKAEIEARLGAITAEMTQVLSATRGDAPTVNVPDDDSDSSDSDSSGSDVDDDDLTSTKREPYVAYTDIQRTYDSTDSEGQSGEDLRMRMRRDCPNASPEVTVVESHAGGGAGMLMNKFKKGVGKAMYMPVVAAGGGAGGGAPKRRELTDVEFDDLRLESSRLERQARKLRRKQDRTTEDNVEAKRIEVRLGKIAEQLESGFLRLASLSDGDDGSDDEEVVDSRANAAPSAVRLFSSLGRGFINQVVPPKDKEKDREVATSPSPVTAAAFADSDEDDEVTDTSKAKAGRSALELSVTSLRKFGRKKKEGKAPPEKGESSGVRRNRSAGRGLDAANPAANVFNQVTDKLAKRGEKLGALDKQGDEMADNATNMRSAAANLRKRQEKQGKFW